MTPFAEFVKNNSKNKENLIGVEIGVMEGVNALYLLEDLPIKELYLVDNYKAYYSGSGWFTDEQQEENYAKTIQKTRKHFGKTMIIKQDSVWAKDLFPNEYFDFVYIDAGHIYKEVMDDLTYWWDKCKPGGVFGGHDYGYPTVPEVKKAVDDFIKSKIPFFIAELNTLFIGTRVGESSEWAIIKP